MYAQKLLTHIIAKKINAGLFYNVTLFKDRKKFFIRDYFGFIDL